MLFCYTVILAPKVIPTWDSGTGALPQLTHRFPGPGFLGLSSFTCETGKVQLFFSAQGEVRAGDNSKSFWEFLEDSILLCFWE